LLSLHGRNVKIVNTIKSLDLEISKATDKAQEIAHELSKIKKTETNFLLLKNYDCLYKMNSLSIKCLGLLKWSNIYQLSLQNSSHRAQIRFNKDTLEQFSRNLQSFVESYEMKLRSHHEKLGSLEHELQAKTANFKRVKP